jgi:hypothetical protein
MAGREPQIHDHRFRRARLNAAQCSFDILCFAYDARFAHGRFDARSQPFANKHRVLDDEDL